MYRKWKSYDIWFLRDGVPQTEFVVILGHFCTLTPLTTWRSKIEKNEKNAWEYHHFTLIYHKWRSYDVWLLRYGAQQIFFLSFWVIFCPFTLLTTQKIKILEKMSKTTEDIIILHKCIKNHDRKPHCSWGMTHDRCNFYFSFWAIFCTFNTLMIQKIKI